MKFLKLPIVFFLFFIFACSVAAGTQEDMLAIVVPEIERVVVMPDGASSIDGYTRHYTVGEGGDVSALYYLHGDGGIHFARGGKLPLILDGGCGVVRIKYSVEEGRVLSIACGGSA